MNEKNIIFGISQRNYEEAAFYWQKKHGFLKKKNIIGICIIICALVSLFGFLSMYFEKDYNPFGTLMFCTLECVLFCFFIVISLKNKLVTRLALSRVPRIKKSAIFTKAEIKDNFLIMTTDYKKNTYDLSSVISIYETEDTLALVFDINSFPITIAKDKIISGSLIEFFEDLQKKVNVKVERV